MQHVCEEPGVMLSELGGRVWRRWLAAITAAHYLRKQHRKRCAVFAVTLWLMCRYWYNWLVNIRVFVCGGGWFFSPFSFSSIFILVFPNFLKPYSINKSRWHYLCSAHVPQLLFCGLTFVISVHIGQTPSSNYLCRGCEFLDDSLLLSIVWVSQTESDLILNTKHLLSCAH